jgi:hypothetical protein
MVARELGNERKMSRSVGKLRRIDGKRWRFDALFLRSSFRLNNFLGSFVSVGS